MAQYRCSVKPRLSRSKGASVARAASYITRERLEDERTGEVYDFSGHKDKALWTGIYSPKNAPEWANDLQKLTNEIERAEKRKDSQLAVPLELSLAHELSVEHNRWMLQDFIRENMTRHGYATIAAIHEPPHGGDPRNIHAHLLVTLRTIDENGFSKTKAEQQDNYMARTEYVEGLRQSWEKHLKQHLGRHGFKEQAAAVSCKTLKEQGIDREAQYHLGPTASDMERKGKQSDRGDINREVAANNQQRQQLTAAEKEITQAIAGLQAQLDKETKAKQAEQLKLAEETRRKAEMERHALEMRARNDTTADVIRKTWGACQDDVIRFMVGLNQNGLYVAQEDGRYIVISEGGFKHNLSVKTYGDTAKAMNAAFDGTRADGLIIPTLDQHFAYLKRQREESRQAFEEQKKARSYQNSVDLNQTQADIRLSFRLTSSGQSFSESLENKGLILAKATEYDADVARIIAGLKAHEQDAAEWQKRAAFKAGDLVVVNQGGHVYTLTERTTGYSRDDITARCATVNHAELLSVEDAKAVMRDAQAERMKNSMVKQRQYGGQRAATLYDRADMVNMQADAMRHIKDARRVREPQRFRQEAEKQRQEEERQREERERRARKEEPSRDQQAEKREHKRDTTEKSDYQQRKAERDALREQSGLRRQEGREGGGRKRERER